MKTYSLDLRSRIVRARGQGHSAQEVARLFGVSKRSVERYCKQHRETGGIEPKRRGGYRRSCLEKHDQTLRRWIGRKADLTLGELQERIRRDLGLQLGITALWHRLERLGLSYKKNAARRRAGPRRHPGRPATVAKPAKRLGHSKAGLSR